MTDARTTSPPRTTIIAAFAAVYIIWGSTYLGIRLAIETIPPFVMASIRFLIAGTLLYAIARARGAPRPTRANWRGAWIVGALLLVGGNGALVWSEQRLPSGIAALLVAMIPLLMVMLQWAWKGVRPSGVVMIGVVLGLVGLALLVQPSSLGGAPVDRIGAGVLMGGALSWAIGSLWTPHAGLPHDKWLASAMEMLVASVMLCAIGIVSGELSHFVPSHVTPRSLWAFAYLVSFGSLVGFTAYVWLLGVASPAAVSTYAYVNPVVALLIGWLFAGEPLTARTLLSGAVIIGAVVFITLGQRDRSPRGTRGAVRAREEEVEVPAA